MSLSSSRYLIVSFSVAAVYIAAALLGLSLATAHTNVSPVWPPTGIAIASLLLLGRQFWPAILLGAFSANLWTGVSAATAGGIAVGNTLEALSAVFFLRKFHFNKQLNAVADVVKLVVCAGILAPIVSATIGNLSLCLGGAAQWSNFSGLWLTWWLGDGFGALVVTPFFLAWGTEDPALLPERRLEGGGLLVTLFFTAMVVFGGWFPGPQNNYPLGHFAFPFLVWAALRLDRRLVTTAIVLLSGVSVWATASGIGAFAYGNPNESLLLLQTFLGTTTLVTLLLHAAVAERKKSESQAINLSTQVEMQRQRLEDIVAHVPGVVWEAWGQPDSAGQQINFVSSFVEKMLGYSEHEWLSTPNFWLSIVHPDDREKAAQEAAQIFASGKGGVSRFRWLRKDEQEVWVEAQSLVVCDKSGRPVGMRGVTMDITQRVKAEAERAELLSREREARAQAEEASRLKDEFLATISHELRTPLNAIVGWTRLFRSQQLDSESLEHALQVIERNAWSQKQIIEDLLDVSRIITGKLRLTHQPVELLPVVHAAIDVIQPAADVKEIEITTKFESLALTVSGDADRLQQVAWNLLSNAVKFTPPHGTIEVRLCRVDDQAQLSIVDTGPGIAPDFLPRAFDRFSQADGSTTRRHGGLGLGLAIVRHLVELHGGFVEGGNRDEGTGAVFTVSLPCFETAQVALEMIKPASEARRQKSGVRSQESGVRT